MSMELYLFLNKSAMPEPVSWQQSITDAGFPLRIDTDFAPQSFVGFLPCVLEDRQTGFEYYLHPREDIADDLTYLTPQIRSFDSVIVFVWGGDLREMFAVMMAAGALGNLVPSVLYFPEDDSIVPGEDALPYARQQISQARKFLTV